MIYVVDDDRSVRRALQRVLTSAGYATEVFSSAAGLLALEQLEHRACVVADFCIPGDSGLEIRRQLTERGETMPVILITALDTDELRQRARLAGVAGYLRKPVDDQALIDAIEWSLSPGSDAMNHHANHSPARGASLHRKTPATGRIPSNHDEAISGNSVRPPQKKDAE